MGLVGNVVTYLIIWWVVIFTVLPWGVNRLTHPAEGEDHGAPEKPMLIRKLFVTTFISAILWYIIKYLIEKGYLTLDLFPF